MDWLSPVRELVGVVFPFLERLPTVRAVLGFILVFFLPGFAWSLVFFRRINNLERVVLSLAMSIAIVTLSLLFINRLTGLSLTGFNSALLIIAVTILPVAVYYLNRLARRGRGKTT